MEQLHFTSVSIYFRLLAGAEELPPLPVHRQLCGQIPDMPLAAAFAKAQRFLDLLCACGVHGPRHTREVARTFWAFNDPRTMLYLGSREIPSLGLFFFLAWIVLRRNGLW